MAFIHVKSCQVINHPKIMIISQDNSSVNNALDMSVALKLLQKTF